MAETWKPSATWKRKLREALNEAFDEPALELLTADYFTTPQRFTRVAPAGIGKTAEFRIHELIDRAEMEDWLLDLLGAARERRPKNQRIGALADEVGLTSAGPRLDNPTSKPFEEIIQEQAKFINPAVFRERLPLLEGQVCWIDVPGGGGTGFLVGPDLVLTNDHVIARLKTGQARWQDVACRFDYRQALDGTPLPQKKQTEVKLDATKPLVGNWPPSQFDFQPQLGSAAPGEIDSALLRLAEAIGDLPVGGDTVDAEAAPRGWIDTSADPPAMAAGNQVFVLQHPKGAPLQLSIGTVTEFNGSGTRIRYNANSKDGSSGSPCFNADLQLVALHHAFDPDLPRKWNQGIPLSTIRQAWKDNNVAVP
jgi:hypothetical protein